MSPDNVSPGPPSIDPLAKHYGASIKINASQNLNPSVLMSATCIISALTHKEKQASDQNKEKYLHRSQILHLQILTILNLINYQTYQFSLLVAM